MVGRIENEHSTDYQIRCYVFNFAFSSKASPEEMKRNPLKFNCPHVGFDNDGGVYCNKKSSLVSEECPVYMGLWKRRKSTQ